jgi:hypothetical protein
MKLQFLFARQDLAANVTHRHVSRVTVHVQLQTVLVLVLLLADDAFVQIGISFVHQRPVHRQVPRVGEVLSAKVAVVRFEILVIVFVFFVPFQDGKVSLADVASVGLLLLVLRLQMFGYLDDVFGVEVAKNALEGHIVRVDAHMRHVIKHLLVAGAAHLAMEVLAVHHEVVFQTGFLLEGFAADVARVYQGRFPFSSFRFVCRFRIHLVYGYDGRQKIRNVPKKSRVKADWINAAERHSSGGGSRAGKTVTLLKPIRTVLFRNRNQ